MRFSRAVGTEPEVIEGYSLNRDRGEKAGYFTFKHGPTDVRTGCFGAPMNCQEEFPLEASLLYDGGHHATSSSERSQCSIA
jgi:hypothetical protein